MAEPAQSRRTEAERLLNEPLLHEALDKIEASAMRDLLAAFGSDADDTRRRCADRINTVRAILPEIHAVLLSAEADLKTPGSVA